MNPKLLTLLSTAGLVLSAHGGACVEEENLCDGMRPKTSLQEDIMIDHFSADDHNSGCGDSGCTSNSGCGSGGGGGDGGCSVYV